MRKPQTILITGASSGLGAALAQCYAAPGIMLFLCGRNHERLQHIASSCRGAGAEVSMQEIDVSDRVTMHNWLKSADTQHPIDLIIANAGISAGTEGGMESEEQVRRIFATNLDGKLNTILPLIPRMQRRGKGQIALVSSLAGYRGLAGAPAYSASKGAIKLFGEGLRGTLADDGINVSVICPGFIKTPMTDVNDYNMPFLMSADKAARKIRRGLSENKGRIAFPWPMVFGIWLLSSLPYTLNEAIFARMPRKSASTQPIE